MREEADWHLLAPGPSASQQLADKLPRPLLGVVTSAYRLAPDARFLCSTDSKFWRNESAAKNFAGHKFTICGAPGITRVRMAVVNSGVFALEMAKRSGAKRIFLHGFDMHGTHFFGQYTNGCANTKPDKRAHHMSEYQDWERANRQHVEVINCTRGSSLTCFRFATEKEIAHIFGQARKPKRSGVKPIGWIA
jgi:hypothetical protein